MIKVLENGINIILNFLLQKFYIFKQENNFYFKILC